MAMPAIAFPSFRVRSVHGAVGGNRPFHGFGFLLMLLATGTLGFGLGREAEVICGVRKADNTFERMTYTFGAEDMGWEKEVREEVMGYDHGWGGKMSK